MRFQIVIWSILIAVLLPPLPSFAKSNRSVPMAPLPSAVLVAKTVYLVNGGGSDLAYDSVYSAMKDWGRYRIVNRSAEADLIMKIQYIVEDRGTRVWSDDDGDVRSVQIVDPKIILTIYDRSSKEQLWSTEVHRRLARREKNREKETANAAQTPHRRA